MELSASRADKYDLYEASVQNAAAEVDFMRTWFRALSEREPRSLREDFCGTGLVSIAWVEEDADSTAIGVDLDAEVLERAGHKSEALSESQRARLQFLQQDVLTVESAPLDIICAFNFSYWLLRERANLQRYFRRCHQQLVHDGILFLDAYGGYDAFRDIEESQTLTLDGKKFTYTWEQEDYDPVSGMLRCNIHFSFPDGSRLDRAFSYEWRLWTLPEISELLQEAGFTEITHYWQGWDENDEPDGDFQPVERGVAEAGWIAYITARKT